jgi:hypothetical protein
LGSRVRITAVYNNRFVTKRLHREFCGQVFNKVKAQCQPNKTDQKQVGTSLHNIATICYTESKRSVRASVWVQRARETSCKPMCVVSTCHQFRLRKQERIGSSDSTLEASLVHVPLFGSGVLTDEPSTLESRAGDGREPTGRLCDCPSNMCPQTLAK